MTNIKKIIKNLEINTISIRIIYRIYIITWNKKTKKKQIIEKE